MLRKRKTNQTLRDPKLEPFFITVDDYCFTIKETASPVSGTYEVLLDTTGTWDYYIYEYTGSAPSNSTGLTQIKEGQCEVLHTASTLQTYGSYQTTFKKYGS